MCSVLIKIDVLGWVDGRWIPFSKKEEMNRKKSEEWWHQEERRDMAMAGM